MGCRQPVVLVGGRDGRIQAGNDALCGQRLHDHASGKGQHLCRINAQALGQSLAAAAGTGQAIGTGTGIGIAGVDQQGAYGDARG